MSTWSQVIFSRDSFTVFFLPPSLFPARPRETTSATSQLSFASACFCILLINLLFSNLFSMKTRNAISGKVYEYETVAGNESYSDFSSGCVDVDSSVVAHSSHSELIRSTSNFSSAEKTDKNWVKIYVEEMQHNFLPRSQPSSSPGWMLRIVCRLTTEDPPLGPLAANSLSAGQLIWGEIKFINKQDWIHLVCLVSNPLHLSWTMFHTFDQLSRYLDVTFKTNTWVGHCQL